MEIDAYIAVCCAVSSHYRGEIALQMAALDADFHLSVWITNYTNILRDHAAKVWTRPRFRPLDVLACRQPGDIEHRDCYLRGRQLYKRIKGIQGLLQYRNLHEYHAS